MLSFPISETMARRRVHKYLDLSTLTEEGIVASTALVVESEGKRKGVLDKVRGDTRELFLRLSLWRKDGIPKLFTSKEWRDVKTNVEGKHKALFERLESWHSDHGPKGLHWYVQLVGTNPDCIGQGYGALVMRKLGELADREKADCSWNATTRRTEASTSSSASRKWPRYWWQTPTTNRILAS
jgi:hypothetical protein